MLLYVVRDFIRVVLFGDTALLTATVDEED